MVKLSKSTRSNQVTAKRNGVLFTYLTSWAVHLEIADDMSAESFILALRGFISLPGLIDIMQSDNGTNFAVQKGDWEMLLKS